MKHYSLKLILTAGMLLSPATSLRAGINNVLIVDAVGYFQAKTNVSGNIQTGTVETFRVNSSQLLALIAKEKGILFPKGSVLMVSDTGDGFVADSSGGKILDASAYVQAKFYRGKELLHGKLNILSGGEDSLTYYSMALKLNFTSIKATLRGIAIGHTQVSEPNADGIQLTRSTTDSKVNGRGVFNGGPGYFEGNIRFSGRGATIR